MNPDYVSSRYVVEADLPDGRTLLANLLWRTFLEVTPEEAELSRQALRGNGGSGPVSESLSRRLIETKMLTLASLNEAAFMSDRYDRSRFSDHVLGLTIAPTIDCNFACAYCYENKRPGRMNAETEAQIIAYVQRMLPGRKAFAVTWYGGEPLLCKDTLLRLSRGFIAASKQHDVSYHAFVITNGYLLHPELTDELAALGHWRKIQVTIDGLRESHDAKRPTKGGGPTFARIIENLLYASTRLPMTVRCNVDRLNPDGCHDLLDYLAQRGLAGKVEIYFAPVHPFGKGCQDIADQAAVSVASNAQFAPIELGLRHHARSLGFVDRGYFARPWLHACQAVGTHSVVVEPDGALQRCWIEIGENDKRIGHISESVNLNGENVLRWLRFDPTRHAPCKDCAVLPVCFGNCPHRHVYGAPEEFTCNQIRYRLREAVVFEYVAQHRPDLLEALNPQLGQRSLTPIPCPAACPGPS